MNIPLPQAFAVGKYVLQQKIKRRERYPLVLMLEPLFRCNLKCPGCGKIQYPPEILKRNLSVEACLRAASECGAPMVSIAGGEPLLHPDITDIVKGLIAQKRYVYLCTNGLLLEKKLAEFTPNRFLTFSIHMDGQRETHDHAVAMTGGLALISLTHPPERWDDWPWAASVGNQWLDEPIRIPVAGGQLERIREYFNFWLGTKLSNLDRLSVGMSRKDVFVAIYPAFDALMKVAEKNFEWFPMCSSSGIALLQLLSGLMPDKVKGGSFPQLDELEDGWTLSTYILTAVREAGKAFDSALSLQFDHLDVYRVMPKGTHDTRKLIEHPELAFESLWKHLTSDAQKDWIGGSRCLAFDLTTACGFHCMRSMEAMAINYMTLMYFPRPKQRDLGTYIRILRNLGAKDQAVDLMEEIRKHHRNPLMHPEDTLDVPQALAVFDLTKSAIIFLVQDMLARGIVS